jgi:hypothetical protein
MKGEGEVKRTSEKSVMGCVDAKRLDSERLKVVGLRHRRGRQIRAQRRTKGKNSSEEPMGEEFKSFGKFW